MKKAYQLGHKITAFCILLAIVICTAVCTSGYYRYRNSTYQIYNDFGYDIAQIALTYVDGDTITDYLKTGKPDAAYNEMTNQLYTLYSKSNLGSIYICVPNADTLAITNIYDVRIEKAEDKTPYMIGVVDPIGSDVPQNVVDVYLTGQRSNDYFLRKTNFGYNTSAIVPVKNSIGKVTALLVVDVPMPYIMQTLNAYLLNTVSITALLVLFFMLFFQILLQRQVVRPLRLITGEAASFIKERTVVSEKLLTVHTHDEIEELAASVYQMETDINTYIDHLTVVTAEKERIGAELDVAKHIQASMLPCIFPAFPERPELDIYATMTPAKEVGGDFYDFFLIDDDRLAMVMADVSGKGVPAALFMVIAKTLLKNVTQTGLSPKDVLEKVNNQLCVNNEAEMFVTVWLGILEISTGELICANAGHEYPVIKRADGNYELIKDKHGFVLAGMEGSHYKEYKLQMNPGDRLFLYTDGVAEATDANNNLYGTDRMLDALNRNKGVNCETLLHRMKEEIDAFVGEAPQFDDITMLSLELIPQNGSGMKKLKLTPTLESIEQVSTFVEQELETTDIPMKVIAQMNIAVDEIFSNIARYSGANDATVGITVEDGLVTLRFADNGRPYDPTEKPDPDIGLSAEDREIGGLGIFMVKKSMDSVIYEYHDGLNILTLTKQI